MGAHYQPLIFSKNTDVESIVINPFKTYSDKKVDSAMIEI